MGLPILICGPSGVGKGTICKELLRLREDLVASVSVTTRAPRPGEKNGREYFFVSKETFARMVEQDEFLEHMHVFGRNDYGTPKAHVLETLRRGNHVIMEIDVRGALEVKKHLPQAVMIFLLPPSMQELKKRLTQRGTDSPEAQKARLETAVSELAAAERFEYLVVNDVVERAVHKVLSIVEAHPLRIEHQRDVLDRIRQGETTI